VRRHLLDQAYERVLDVAVLPAAGSALMHQRFSQDLGHYGWGRHPWIVLPAANKGVLRTCARRNYLGTEVMEGRVQVHRGRRAPVQPWPETIPAPARAIRAAQWKDGELARLD